MSRFSEASTAPANAVASHGCATAVGTGSRVRHLASSCSYFPVPETRAMFSSCECFDRRVNRRPGFFQEEGENDRQADTNKERRERRLVMFELHLGEPAADGQQNPAEDRCEQGAEREVQEVDDAC